MRSIRGRIALTYIVLTIALLMVCTILTLQFGLNSTFKQHEVTTIQQAKTLAQLIPVSAFETPNSTLITEFGSKFSSANPGTHITILDQHRMIQYDSDLKTGQVLEDPLINKALQGSTSTDMFRSNQSFRNIFFVAVPIMNQGKVIGALLLGTPVTGFSETVLYLWDQIGKELIIVTIGGLLVGLYFAFRIAAPIEEVTQVTGRIAAGAFHERIHFRSRDELGEMSESVNRMATKLGDQIEDLTQEKSKLEGIIAYMESGLIVVDRSGRILMVNQAIEKLLRSPISGLVGKWHWEVGNSYGLSSQIDDVLLHGEKNRSELVLPNGKDTIVQVNFSPIHGKQEAIVGAVVVMHDVSEWKRLEQMRTEFVANVSHELRTPITAIKGFAETLLDGAMQDEDMREQFIKIIYSESDRMSRLVNDLLDLSKIESRHGIWNFEDVNISKLVMEIVERLLHQAEQHQLQLKAHIPTEPIIVEVDRDRMSQVLFNLIGNAIAYTPELGQIDVIVEPQATEVLVHVRDTGIGIPQSDIPRLFERFYRVDKARSRRSGGTGLGLAIVKHIMEIHHGSVRVNSEVGQGSTFTVCIPYLQRKI